MTDHRDVSGTLLERSLPTADAVAERGVLRAALLRKLESVRERRRADNLARYASATHDSARDFSCECARPDCRVRLPLEVERHRRGRDRFIVGLAHADRDTVVGIADDFLIVRTNGRRT